MHERKMASVTLFYCLTVGCLLVSLYPREILTKTSPRSKLLSDLFQDYDKRIAPGEVDAGYKNLTIGMSLISIIDLDIETRLMKSILWFVETFSDPRLTWKPSDYGNITLIRVPQSDIWTPDIEFYNAISRPEFLSMTEYNVVVMNTGHVTFVPGLKVKTRCKPTNRYDEITCSWKVGSWAYDGSYVDIRNDKNTIDMSDFVSVDSINWNITETKVWREAKSYPCCSETYPAVTGRATLRRRV